METFGKTLVFTAAALFLLSTTCFTIAEEKFFEYEVDGKKVRHKYVIGAQEFAVPKGPKPAKGKPYFDPNFGCKVTRITDKDIDDYAKHKTKYMNTIYSTMDHENFDGTYVMLGSWKYFLYDLKTYKLVKRMGVSPRSGCQWNGRWHPTDPKLYYYTFGTKLMLRDVTGPSKAVAEDKVVHDFSPYVPGSRGMGTSKGTPSVDGRYWVFGVGGEKNWKKVVMYDLKENKVVAQITTKGAPKWCGASLSGDYIIISGRAPAGPGVWSYPRDNLDKPVKIAPTITHSDVAIDADGNEVYVYENDKNDWIEAADLKTGKVTKIIKRIHKTRWGHSGGGKHITGNCWKTPGWVLVSTYGGQGKRGPCWQSWVNHMLEIKEGGRIWILCHNHSVHSGQRGRGAASQTSINTEGSRAYWTCNWDDPDGIKETFMVELPTTWHEDLMGKAESAASKKKARKTLHLE